MRPCGINEIAISQEMLKILAWEITDLRLQPYLRGTNVLPTMVYDSSYQLCQEDQLQACQTSSIAFPEIWSK